MRGSYDATLDVSMALCGRKFIVIVQSMSTDVVVRLRLEEFERGGSSATSESVQKIAPIHKDEVVGDETHYLDQVVV